MIIAGALIFKMAASRLVGVSKEKVNTMKENAILKGTKDATIKQKNHKNHKTKTNKGKKEKRKEKEAFTN